MVAGQKMVADDGKEVMLFPLPYMNISQGELETFSHAGILAMDFLGWDADGRECKAIIDPSNNGRIFQSLDMVHTPNGLQYVTFMCFHDNNPIALVGSRYEQGDIFAHTGTAGGVTGDHTHFNTANGGFYVVGNRNYLGTTYTAFENRPMRQDKGLFCIERTSRSRIFSITRLEFS